MKRLVVKWIVIIFALGTIILSWNKWVRPTRIALINFSDFQISRLVESNTSFWIDVDFIKMEQDAELNLKKYDFVMTWAHGRPFSESMRSSLRRATASGVAIYCMAATSAENDFTSINTNDVKRIEEYLENGGAQNYGRLYNYIRKYIHKAKLFTPQVQSPVKIASTVIFHLEETYFTTVSEYEEYLKINKKYKKDAPRVALFTSNLGPRNSGRSDIDSLITALEREGMMVYAVDGFSDRMGMLDSINPDVVISQPHGRFIPGKDRQTIQYLKSKNIPLLAPIKVFNIYDKWVNDQRGMDGGVLGQNVVVPELDGAIESFVVAAQFQGKNGYADFQAIPGRPQRFARRVANWIQLQKMENKSKKVSIVYLKAPGQNALVAGGLEVVPSLYALLQKLKMQGYSVEGLPATVQEFEALIHQKGVVPGVYAQGAIERLQNSGAPAKIHTNQYIQWAKETLDSSSWAQVEKQYGPAPGPYMSQVREDSSFIFVSKIEFGNIAILPQPLPGYGENEFALVHGSPNPPPHPYIAAYLWAAKGFESDAIIHFGTHGSFEFLPGKQVAQSSKDWSDALIGDMPHGYVYVINNIGEAMMAKRRGYAVMLSHLTPPFMSSGLYGDLNTLHDKMHHYLLPDIRENLRQEYGESIRDLVIQLNMDKDLSFDSLQSRALSIEEINKVHNHLHALEQEKIGKGLYRLGRPYSSQEACSTAVLMHLDVIAHSLAQIDIEKELASAAVLQDKHQFELKYREKAMELVDMALQGKNAFSHAVKPEDIELLNSEKEKRKLGAYEPIAISAPILDSNEIVEILSSVLVKETNRTFIKKWESNREYQRILALLDPVSRKRFDKIAGMIPEMKAIAQALDEPGMTKLISISTDTTARRFVINMLDNPDLKVHLEEQAWQRDSVKKVFFATPSTLGLFKNMATTEFWKSIKQIGDTSLMEYQALLQDVLMHETLVDSSVHLLLPELKNNSMIVQQEVNSRKQKKESIINTLKQLENALHSVKASKHELLKSTNQELESIVNMLNGGYIEPSPGGDPVANPSAVPTGRNLYAINAESTPTREAWKTAVRMMDALLMKEVKTQGRYPQKIALTLWGGEFVRDQGTTLAQAFYLMGVEPVWNSRGRMHDVKVIPAAILKRPRIDVVVQTSGQFRDMGASRLYLLNKAARMINELPAEDSIENFVQIGTKEAEQEMIQSGTISPLRAAKLSKVRVFGGVNGNYGTGIMPLVEAGDKWENEKQIQNQYVKNMGAVYDEDEWASYEEGVFTAALRNTEIVLQSRSSNTTGPISLDHTYEFMGGLISAVRGITGKDPRAYFTDTRSRLNPVVQDAKEAVWVEARATILNPKYVSAQLLEGATAAENFAEAIRNTYGWNVMKPDIIDNELWEKYYDMFQKDKHDLGVKSFFEEKNPWAYQELTAVMLETIRKGYWETSEQITESLANEHAEWVAKHGAGCSGFVCDNVKLKEFVQKKAPNQEIAKKYSDAIAKAIKGSANNSALVMQKQEFGMQASITTIKVPVLGGIIFALLLGVVYFWWTNRRKRPKE
jgi:cobaltochelatase CobN